MDYTSHPSTTPPPYFSRLCRRNGLNWVLSCSPVACGLCLLSLCISVVTEPSVYGIVGKTTWYGSGAHIPNVMNDYPLEEWCTCAPRVEWRNPDGGGKVEGQVWEYPPGGEGADGWFQRSVAFSTLSRFASTPPGLWFLLLGDGADGYEILFFGFGGEVFGGYEVERDWGWRIR